MVTHLNCCVIPKFDYFLSFPHFHDKIFFEKTLLKAFIETYEMRILPLRHSHEIFEALLYFLEQNYYLINPNRPPKYDETINLKCQPLRELHVMFTYH
jgi:hypothetical protein